MLKIGFGLFASGLLVAVTAAAKAPAKVGDWPDTWPIFVGGALVSIIGLLLWRRAAAAATAQAVGDTSGLDPVGLLRDLQAPLQAFESEIGELDCAQIVERVDAILAKFVLPFANVRHLLVARFGMEQGAEVLVTIAYGERLLNRVWSAAADGHAGEARACLPEAGAAFREAVALIGAPQAA